MSLIRCAFIMLLTVLAFSFNAQAQNSYQDVLTNAGDTHVGKNATAYINVHGKGCKAVTNKYDTSDDLYIPFSTVEEWESFLDFADNTNDIDISPCSFIGSTWDTTCDAPTWNTDNNPATCGQTCTVTCLFGGFPVDDSYCTDPRPADYVVSTSCDPEDLSCTLDGQTIPTGTSVTAYTSSVAPNGQTCAVISQTRTCTNGMLSGSGTYSQLDCSDNNSCTLDGQTIASGTTVTAYTDVTAPSGQTCATISQSRTCTNGVLSGSNSYDELDCSNGNNCALPWGGTIANGQSVTAYRYATEMGYLIQTQCSTSEVRTCNNGTLSGSYTNQSCSYSQIIINPQCVNNHCDATKSFMWKQITYSEYQQLSSQNVTNYGATCPSGAGNEPEYQLPSLRTCPQIGSICKINMGLGQSPYSFYKCSS